MSTPTGTPDVETELKFELQPPDLKRLRKHPAFAAALKARRLRSVYFDTPDHDLRNRGLSLRVREADGRFVQTVKRRHGGAFLDRDEWEAPVDGEGPDKDALRNTPPGAALNGEVDQLAPIFTTTVQRSVHLWKQGEAIVELSLDEGEVTAGDQREAIRELELELKSGEPSALFDLARELALTTGLRLSFDSKGERGYRLAGHDGLAAIKAERTTVTADLPAGEAFRAIARASLAQAARNAQLLRRVRSPEALHQMRVGLRRFRATLSAFRPLVEDERLEGVKAEARWLIGALDEARDLDVFIHETFKPAEALAPEDPALEALGKRLLHAQAQAYERALAAINSPRFDTMMLEAAAWVEVGPWTHDAARAAARDRSVAAFGAEAMDGLWRRSRRKGARLAAQDAGDRHEFRLRIKKLRYAAEFFADALAPAGDKRRRKFVAALKRLQDALGALNDRAVARDRAVGFVGARSGELAFTAGMLVGRRERDEPALLAEAIAACDGLRDAKPFWKRSRRAPAATVRAAQATEAGPHSPTG